MGVVFYFIITSFTVILSYALVWASRHYSYWKKKGVKGPNPWYFIGNSLPMIKPQSEIHSEVYKRYYNERYVGFYEIAEVSLLIIDPALIETILIKDFSYFMDRSNLNADNFRKTEQILPLLKGSMWRAIRYKLSPTFSTGKLKVMFDSMVNSYNNLDNLLTDKIKDGEQVEAREMMFAYTSDIIASCAFGIDTSKDKKSGSDFKEMGMKSLKMDFFRVLRIILLIHFPKFGKYFHLNLLNEESGKYFSNILKSALKLRYDTGYKRNDFLQLLMQIKDKGRVEYHSIEPEDQYLNLEQSETTESFEFTEDLLIAQSYIFINAGMEPTSNTLTFACAELAKNVEIQDRVRKEINETLKNHDNQFTYQALKDMTFLEMCINETLRMYPTSKQLSRVCTRKYNLDNFTLDVGNAIIIPIAALHFDLKYFPDPLKFNPDRFKEPKHPPGAFAPFGSGPRICIGMRFGMIEMKICLAKLISNYRLKPGDDFIYPVPLNKWSFFSVPSNPVHIKLEKINI